LIKKIVERILMVGKKVKRILMVDGKVDAGYN